MKCFKKWRDLYKSLLTIPSWLSLIVEKEEDQNNLIYNKLTDSNKLLNEIKEEARAIKRSIELEERKNTAAVESMAEIIGTQAAGFKLMAEYFKKEIELAERYTDEYKNTKPTEHDLKF